MRTRPEHGTVDRASRGVQDQLAQVERRLAEGSFEPTTTMLLRITYGDDATRLSDARRGLGELGRFW